MHCQNIAKLILSTSRNFKTITHLKYTLNCSFTLPIHKKMFSTHKTKSHLSTQPKQQDKILTRPFSDFITDEVILSKLAANGLEYVFPIQEQTFNYVLQGRDVLASDRTGSGKTLAYTLPVLQKFKKAGLTPSEIKLPKFLVLCPTRQLAIQVTNEINKINSGYRVTTLYGGSSIQAQIRELQRGVAIIVATPGRLIDLIDRETVKLNELQVVAIDEADTMLQKGFKLDVQKIFGYVRKSAGKTQNIMFSATIPPWVIEIANSYFEKVVKINLIKDQDVRTSQTVDHFALLVRPEERHSMVTKLIQKYNPDHRTIIFTKTKAEANDFIKYFDQNQIVILHGDISQNIREQNMSQFKKGSKKILIATDIAARGLDIPDVQLIIQLSPPENPEPYIHRSGRTGRAGKQGLNITFFDESNIRNLLQIQTAANIKIKLINNNFNITLWKNQASKLVSKVISASKNQDTAIYQGFADEILKSVNPKDAIVCLIKQKLGMAPKTTSVLTNKKGYVSFKYNIVPTEQLDIQRQFPQIKIQSIIKEKDSVKFDILAEDCFKFEQIIESLNLDIQLLDQNDNMSLKQFSLSHMSSSRNNSNYRNSWSSRRQDDNREYRPRRDDPLDREDRGFRNRRDDNNFDRGDRRRPEVKEITLNDGQNKFFLFGFSKDLSDEQLQVAIKDHANINDFKLKVVRKVDQSGNDKVFGFLTVKSFEDATSFMSNDIQLANGSVLKKKLSQTR